MNNFTKMMFLMMMMLSTMITISSYNWLGMWMGMEMNLMFFIPLISKNKNMKSSQAMMIYFMTQSIGSMILLFSILVNSTIMISPVMMEEITKSMLMISLLIKLGVAPFHNWYLEVLFNLKWIEALILMVWQKIAGLFILSNIIMNNMIYIMIMITTFIGAIGGINISSLMKLLGYSSINHMGWILLMMNNENQWYLYFMFYSIILIMACLFFNKFNIYYINQMYSNINSPLEKLNYTIIFLSIGGLPPFLGFIPKWMVLYSSNNILLLLLMMMMSLITLFYYMRIISSSFMMFSSMNKWMNFNSSNFMIYNLILNLILPVFSIISFI
uniref:NADH dehydrogenase subunit 2 n=1 Tax=Cymoninus sechellensis TaxID=3103804 RepID=UPI002E7963ED|nr:NADH dehydrogenase subunit 2 [Cymoninus sechellensis]WPW49235.1 NADH dehydrogenase subunit 2 [Cymoninus sechellensis]